MSEKLHIDITATTASAVKELTKLDQAVDSTAAKLAAVNVQNTGPVVSSQQTTKSLQEVKGEFLDQLRVLQTYRDLGLEVSTQLQQSWQEYFLWLSQNYDQDSLEYAEALAMKTQADQLYYTQSKRRLIEHNQLTKAGYNSINTGFMAMFEDMGKLQAKSNNTLEKGFVAMANAFIHEVERMAARWLAFQLLKATLSPLGILGFSQGGAVGTVKAASGGRIYGGGTSTSDSIPAMLSAGEYVVNAKAAQGNYGLLNSINSNTGSLEARLDTVIALLQQLGQQQVNVVVNPDAIVSAADPTTVYKSSERGSSLMARW